MLISFSFILIGQSVVFGAILYLTLRHHTEIQRELLDRLLREIGHRGLSPVEDKALRPKVPVAKEIGREVFPVR